MCGGVGVHCSDQHGSDHVAMKGFRWRRKGTFNVAVGQDSGGPNLLGFGSLGFDPQPLSQWLAHGILHHCGIEGWEGWDEHGKREESQCSPMDPHAF